MIQNFRACLAFDERKDIEGGNDDDKQDPGGRTSRGIEQAEYDAWCHLHDIPTGDVWKAPQTIIDAIYEHSYWQPYCDLIPRGADLMYFDTAVNEGPGKAVLFLQRALGIYADGHFGIVTAAAVRRMGATSANVEAVINMMADERRDDYHRDRGFRRFGNGWLSRVTKCEAASVEMLKNVHTV
jgi:lysozyme family protein